MPTDALSEFQRVYSADTTSVAAMVGIGSCQMQLNNPAIAEKMLRRAVEHAPRDAAARRWLGDALALREQNAEAVSQYRMAVQLDATMADAHLGLGRTLERAGDLAAAEEALAEGLRHSPGNPQLHYQLGVVYLGMNDPGRARAQLESALVGAGDDPSLRATIQAALDSIH
jgi:Flp pilus assembly protein TadD